MSSPIDWNKNNFLPYDFHILTPPDAKHLQNVLRRIAIACNLHFKFIGCLSGIHLCFYLTNKMSDITYISICIEDFDFCIRDKVCKILHNTILYHCQTYCLLRYETYCILKLIRIQNSLKLLLPFREIPDDEYQNLQTDYASEFH